MYHGRQQLNVPPSLRHPRPVCCVWNADVIQFPIPLFREWIPAVRVVLLVTAPRAFSFAGLLDSQGWFESVYLDQDLRVTRDVRGDVTVLVKSQE